MFKRKRIVVLATLLAAMLTLVVPQSLSTAFPLPTPACVSPTAYLVEKWCFRVLWMLFVAFLTSKATERYTKKYWATWFRPSPSVCKDEHEWSEIEEIMLRDPLDSYDYFRGVGWDSVLSDVIVLFAGVFILTIATGFLWGFFVFPPNPPGNNNVLPVVAALLTLAGVLYTIRARVRSENRQKWIDEVRRNLALVINYAAQKNALHDHLTDPAKPAPPLYPDANLARLTLELMINPSEKDHRALSTLLRLLCGIKLIDIDKEVTNKLPCLVSDNDHRKLITWTIRLSNATLKREWELIKYGR